MPSSSGSKLRSSDIRPLRRTVILALLVAGLASCASLSASPPGPSVSAPPLLDVAGIDPCSLLDAEALAVQLLQPVEPGVRVADAATGTAACRWTLTSGLGSVVLVVRRDPASSVSGEEILESIGPQPGLEELHGIGDAAWFGYCPPCPSPATTTLTVIAAPLEFSFAFEGASPSLAELIHAEALARRLIEELGL